MRSSSSHSMGHPTPPGVDEIERPMPLCAHRHGAVPAPLSRAGRSRQFGRASAPMMPHRVHTMRGPNVGTGVVRANVRRSARSAPRRFRRGADDLGPFSLGPRGYASSLVIFPLRIVAAMPSSMLAASSASQHETRKVAPTDRSVRMVTSGDTPFVSHFFTASVRAFAANSCCASSDFREPFIRFQSMVCQTLEWSSEPWTLMPI
jgi:hypothetical protein